MGEKVRGSLLLIGGAEDKCEGKEILKEFVELTGERDSYLVILTVATTQPERVGRDYKEIFSQLGLKEIEILHINDRLEAQSGNNADLIMDAGGIFFTGGDQLRITSLLGGTLVNKALTDAYEAGAIIAGTSAGASVVSDVMIVSGINDETPQIRSVQLSPGLGMLEEVVIDQHFAQRGRIGRLMMAVAYNPYVLGIGLDEDTAIKINNWAEFTVYGSRTVTVIDGKGISHSNVYEIGESQPLAMLDVRVHILSAGYKFNLKQRKVIIPE